MLSYVDNDCIEDSNEFEFIGLPLPIMSAGTSSMHNSTGLIGLIELIGLIGLIVLFVLFVLLLSFMDKM